MKIQWSLRMADLLDETCSILTMECNDTHLAGVANKFRQSGRPDSRLVLQVNLKSMCPRLSRSSILETQNCVQAKNKYKPVRTCSKIMVFTRILIHIMNIFSQNMSLFAFASQISRFTNNDSSLRSKKFFIF